MSETRSLEEIIKAASGRCINANGDATNDLENFLKEAFESGQQSIGSLVRISFVTWDPDTDGVAILHDGELAWQENTFDRLSQYLRNNELVGTDRPVILEMIDPDAEGT
jgi:hypothetical protein